MSNNSINIKKTERIDIIKQAREIIEENEEAFQKAFETSSFDKT